MEAENNDTAPTVTLPNGVRIKDATGRLQKAIDQAMFARALKMRMLTVAAFMNERAFRIEIPPSGFNF